MKNFPFSVRVSIRNALEKSANWHRIEWRYGGQLFENGSAIKIRVRIRLEINFRQLFIVMTLTGVYWTLRGTWVIFQIVNGGPGTRCEFRQDTIAPHDRATHANPTRAFVQYFNVNFLVNFLRPEVSEMLRYSYLNQTTTRWQNENKKFFSATQ